MTVVGQLLEGLGARSCWFVSALLQRRGLYFCTLCLLSDPFGVMCKHGYDELHAGIVGCANPESSVPKKTSSTRSSPWSVTQTMRER